MKEVKSILIKTEITVFILTLGSLFAAVFFKKYLFAYGLAIGAFFGLINFRLLIKSAGAFTKPRLGKSPSYARFFITYLLRFIMIMLIFSLCILKDIQVFAAAVCGFLFVQISIFINNFLPEKKCRN
ncbi:MAG: hypothetical protein ABH836_06950 [Candidatus Omnitrophota bacterium]